MSVPSFLVSPWAKHWPPWMHSDLVHPCPVATEIIQALPPVCQLLIPDFISSSGQEEVLGVPVSGLLLESWETLEKSTIPE